MRVECNLALHPMVSSNSTLSYKDIIKGGLSTCHNELQALEDRRTDALSTKLVGDAGRVSAVCSKLLDYAAQTGVHCALDMLTRRIDTQPLGDSSAIADSAANASPRNERSEVHGRVYVTSNTGLSATAATKALPSCTDEGCVYSSTGPCGSVIHGIELCLTHGSQGECAVAALLMANPPD